MLFEPGPLPELLRAWLDAEPGGPVIFTTFGSIVDFSDAAYAAILAGLGDVAGARVIWSLRRGASASVEAALADGTAPANVRVERWVPQLEVRAAGAARPHPLRRAGEEPALLGTG